jgi:biopolymer transport protein ExbD
MKLMEKPPKKTSINLTPLIDVLFILIIFFTVSSTFLEQPGIELKLPEAESSQSHTAQKVIIYVDAEKNLFLNDDPVTLDHLAESVEAMISAQTDKSVVLNADEGVTHGLIVRIMDSLRKKGIYKIILSTAKPFPTGQAK